MKNDLGVWTLSYRKSYYLTHPWKLFHELYWNIKNFFHRGKYGYAYVDVWNWYVWWTQIGADALRYLAKHHSGYPSYEPWETPEKWEQYLNVLADKLEWCLSTCDIGHENNPLKSAYDGVNKRCSESGKDEHGFYYTRLNTTPADEEVIKEYWNNEEELTRQDEEMRAGIFAEIGRNLPKFWD